MNESEKIKRFEEELSRRGIEKWHIEKYVTRMYKLIMNCCLLWPIEVFAIVQAFVPFTRTTGYYDFSEAMLNGVVIVIVVEIAKFIFLRPIIKSGIFNAELMYEPYCQGNPRTIKVLDKVESLVKQGKLR